MNQYSEKIEIRYCACGNPIPRWTSSGAALSLCRYKTRKTCGCKVRQKARPPEFVPPPRLCEGICGELLKRKPSEYLGQFMKRNQCGAEACRQEISLKSKQRAKLKNCKKYYVKPDCVERFNLRAKII